MNRRWLSLVLIPALLVAAIVFDHRDDTERERRAGASAAGSVSADADLSRAMPVAAPSDALSSTWYCAGGTATDGGAANQTVIVFNPTDHDTTGSITAVPSKGKATSVERTIAPRSLLEVPLTDLVTAPYAAALVEFRGGEIVVEHRVEGPLGVDTAPCTTTASDRWYFASGATTLRAKEVLALFNPFPEAASVDIAFVTSQGYRTPGPFKGLQVPARSVVAVPVTQLGPEPQVSTIVTTRSGRIVADRIQTHDGGRDAAVTGGGKTAKGLTVTLGVPRAATSWVFPYGEKDEGLHERFVVFNPSGQEAEVDVAVTLADPEHNGEADPFSITVNPRSFEVVDIDDGDRIPTRVDQGTTVVSRNGVPVVAERLLATSKPFTTFDTAASTGSPLVANRWVFAAGANVPKNSAEWIGVSNPTGRSITVDLQVIIGGTVRSAPKLRGIAVPAHGHALIQFDRPAAVEGPKLSVVLLASGPVVAERVLVLKGGARASTAPGIPAGTATLARIPTEGAT